MKAIPVLTVVVASCVCAGAAVAADYDFYAGMRYPGGQLRPDVDVYHVKHEGTGDPQAYQRREVDWWPRKGVDIVEITEGMPERTWTPKTQRLAEEPVRLKAHLVGFRGMGNTMSSKYRGDGGPIEPGVVLRLPDGRKRCFVRGSFSDEDKQYVLDLYVKEMQRIKAGLDKTLRVKPPNADIRWPNNAKPGQPGTMQVESGHFVWVSGSQAGSQGDPWVNEKEPDKAQWYRDGSVECAEYWWALTEYAGNLMPHWDRKKALKYEITVAGTKRDGHEVIGGYAGGGYGGCLIKGAGGGPWAPALWHEWGHGALPNHIRIGGGEAQADTHQCLADPSMLKGNHHLKTPWRNIFNASMGYGYTIFYNITGDDPNWGYAYFTCLPYGVDETSVLLALARVGQQRGLFHNGIRGLGDMVGEYAARLATFDCELEDIFCRHYFAPTRSWLETVDRAEGIYRIPWEEAPEPFGVNIVRLVPDDNARQFAVVFRGLHDPDCYGDWRACIVAVGHDGRRRYSPMWNKGEMTMECRADDCAYWLTVAATPTALYTGDRGQNLYSGRHAYRYPWSVQLSGARPGTPRNIRADLGEMALLYPDRDGVPQPHDTAAGIEYLRKLTELLKRPNNVEAQVRAEVDRMKTGKRHANGGGWVADSASAAATAYVGRDAMVLGNAQVLDQAIVEDYAVVTGSAVVSDHARVSGGAVIKDNAKVNGYSRTWASLGGSDEASFVPKRLAADKLHEFGLWANYAMDRQENTLLEDWYRFAYGADRRYGRSLGPNLNGYLYGRPEFVVDGDRRGFRFDGKTHYAELCPQVADLGAITVEIIVKWEGQGTQTILDFGSSPDNCFVLKTAKSGKLELVATVSGETVVALTAAQVLPRNEWVSLRVEIDGSKTALWLNGNKVAEKSASFRPCDAFPGGKEKRNFLAASREGSGHLQGIVDRVVVYHAVHDDFGAVPEPIRDAPIRPTAQVVEAIEKAYGNVDEVNRKIQAGVAEMTKPYDRLKQRQEARVKELKERNPAFLAAEEGLAATKRAVDERKRELSMEFDKLPEMVEMKTQIELLRVLSRQFQMQARRMENERLGKDEELATIQAERKETEKQLRDLDRQLRAEFEKRAEVVEERAALAEMRKQLDGLKREIGQLEKEAREKDDKLTALQASRKEMEETLRNRDRALHSRIETFRSSNEEYAGLDARVRDLGTKQRDRENLLREELRRTKPMVSQLNGQKAADQQAQEKDRALREKRDLYVSKRAADMVVKVGVAERVLQEATEEALAPYIPEKLWLQGFGYQAFRGYYNTNYGAYIRDHVKAQVGGGEMREDVRFLTELSQAVAGNKDWSTTVDWDWRMKPEADGTINDLPLLQKWIRRARGPVVTEKPVGATGVPRS